MKTSSAVTAGHRGLEDSRIYKLALTGLFAALSYVVFTFLQIKITLPGGDATSIHLGNAVCVLGALILGGFYGGLGGAPVCGLLFNVIFDPLVGYFYKLAILGKPAADLVLAWNIASTSINAVTSAAAAVVIYMPLRSTLIRSGLFDRFR